MDRGVLLLVRLLLRLLSAESGPTRRVLTASNCAKAVLMFAAVALTLLVGVWSAW